MVAVRQLGEALNLSKGSFADPWLQGWNYGPVVVRALNLGVLVYLLYTLKP